MTIETRTFTTKVDNHLYQFTVELNPEEAKAGNFQSMHVLDVKELPPEESQAKVVQTKKEIVKQQPKASKGLSNAALDGAMVGAFVSATSAGCIGVGVTFATPSVACMPVWVAPFIGVAWAGAAVVGCVIPSIVGCGALFHFDAQARNAQLQPVVVTQPISLSHTTTTV